MTDWAKTANKNIAAQYREIYHKVSTTFQNCDGGNAVISFTPQELVHLMKLADDAANGIDRKLRLEEKKSALRARCS